MQLLRPINLRHTRRWRAPRVYSLLRSLMTLLYYQTDDHRVVHATVARLSRAKLARSRDRAIATEYGGVARLRDEPAIC